MARLAMLDGLRRFPCLLDMVDVDSAKWTALSANAAPPLKWVYRREARVLARFETQATFHAFATLVVNEKERDTLTTLAPGARVEILPIGIDVDYYRPSMPVSPGPVVVFCGVMNYKPNEEAACWLAKEVWPLVLSQRPDARLRLVGSNPTAAVRGLASSDRRIEVTGWVADVRPYLWEAAVAAAPIWTARGVQTKVLEAVAAGLPTVVTSAVGGGLPRGVLDACSTADSAVDFAACLVAFLSCSMEERGAILSRLDMRALSWESLLTPLRPLLEAAANVRHDESRSVPGALRSA
jgi:glycosyltransferase involved in cell wall biosynthesis